MKAQRTFNMKPNYYGIKGSKLNPWRQENSKEGFQSKIPLVARLTVWAGRLLKHIGSGGN